MKPIFLKTVVLALLIFAFSCNDSTRQNESKAPNPPDTTLRSDCVSLTVHVVGPDNKDIPGAKAYYHVHGFDSTMVKLDLDKIKTVKIYKTQITSYVNCQTGTYANSIKFGSIDKDMKVVFVVSKCQ